ncbi:hypothetical protein [Lysobacter enzymogenes]|uniref:hypothetical protein n=1 Tax=Lysobacter enzymogenes TaxID=69 RepID=UPI0019CF871F|nr:hypothetical protein [Lysobacter enzymogenes]
MTVRNDSTNAETPLDVTGIAPAATVDDGGSQRIYGTRSASGDDLRPWHERTRRLARRKDVPWTCPGNWDNRVTSRYTEDNEKIGKARFEDVTALHDVSEFDAYQVIKYALTSPNWRGHSMGLEEGFADMIARAAVAGLNALACGAPGFDPNDFAESAGIDQAGVRIRGAGFDVSQFRYAAPPRKKSHIKPIVIDGGAHSDVMNALWAIERTARVLSERNDDCEDYALFYSIELHAQAALEQLSEG